MLKNFEGFTKEEILKAELSRKMQSMLGNPSALRFKEIGIVEGLRDCPIEFNDVTNSSTICCRNRKRFRGASIRHKPKRVREEYMKITEYFYCLHKFFTLASDFMFVNIILFLVNFSRNVRLITVEHIPTRTEVQLVKLLMNIFKLYARGGFVIRLV